MMSAGVKLLKYSALARNVYVAVKIRYKAVFRSPLPFHSGRETSVCKYSGNNIRYGGKRNIAKHGRRPYPYDVPNNQVYAIKAEIAFI